MAKNRIQEYQDLEAAARVKDAAKAIDFSALKAIPELAGIDEGKVQSWFEEFSKTHKGADWAAVTPQIADEFRAWLTEEK